MNKTTEFKEQAIATEGIMHAFTVLSDLERQGLKGRICDNIVYVQYEK